MKISWKHFVTLALVIVFIGATTGVAGATGEQSDMFAEPFEVTGGQEEQAFLDASEAAAFTFSSQAVGDVVTVNGAGYGHGVGMSQWGAYGQAHADPGTTYQDILAFYYGGVSRGTSLVSYDAEVPGHDNLAVNLEYDRTDLVLRVLDTNSTAPGGGHTPATVTRGTDSIELTHPQTVQIQWNDENLCSLSFRTSTNLTEVPFEEWVEGSCDVDIVWDGEADSPSTKIEIVGCLLKDWDAGADRPCQYGRGAGLHTIDNESPLRNPSGVDAAYDGFDLILDIDVDDYTLGIYEISNTWPDAALQSQAVAARSYGAAAAERYDPMSRTCACDVYDTSASQRYVGWGHIGAYIGGEFTQQNWVDACNATDNVVLASAASSDNGIISAVYSAANGGASENNEDIWGGAALPYLRSTPDPFDLERDTRWVREIPVDYFASKVGLDVVTSAEIVSTYVSGSPSDIAVTGTVGGVEATRHYTAVQFMALFSSTAYRFYAPRITDVNVPQITTPPPPPPVEFQIERWWGRDRYVTAVEISKANFPTGANAVFIATGENFPDALAAAPLAYDRNAPVLLSKTSSIPQETIDEIKRLDPDRIYILGGTAAVSAGVATQLQGYASVTRVAGNDRYATAAEISKTTYPGGSDVVYFATGRNFPDPLVGAPLAGYNGGPILLTDGTALTGATLSELVRLAPKSIVVVGAGTSVSQTVVDQLKGYAPVVGISGSDRYETSVKMSQQTFDSTDVVFVATGGDFPDALAVGPAAIDAGGPLLLVSTTSLPATVAAELVRLDPDRVVILGGTSAVSAAVEEAIDALFD